MTARGCIGDEHEVGHTRSVANDLRTAVLLSMQRALWEQVTPDLRGVAIAWSGALDHGAQVTARFLYEGDAEQVQRQCVSETEAYFAADFLADMSTSFVAVEHADLDLEVGEEWVFLRWEPRRSWPINRTDMPLSAHPIRVEDIQARHDQ
jgi:hypothetical protein